MNETPIPYEAIFAALQETPEGRAQMEIASLKALVRIQQSALDELRKETTP